MGSVLHNDLEKLRLLELVLQMHREFRRRVEPIRMTLLQAACGPLLSVPRCQVESGGIPGCPVTDIGVVSETSPPNAG